MADDYEMVSEKEMSDLKKEIKKVKENPLGDSESSDRFYKTIDGLSDSMSNMLNLFKIAADSMQNEEKEEVFLAERIKPISEKVDRLLEQNEKIAKALVAIADMIDELKTNQKKNPLDDLRQQMPSSVPASNPIPQYVQSSSMPQAPSFAQPSFSQASSQIPPQMQGFGKVPEKPSIPSMSGLSNNAMGSFPQQSQAPQMSQQQIPSMGPSPFLDDDPSQGFGGPSVSQGGLPPFSEFSGDKKMSMPPPPQDMFGGMNGFGGMGSPNSQVPPQESQKKKGLFGMKK